MKKPINLKPAQQAYETWQGKLLRRAPIEEAQCCKDAFIQASNDLLGEAIKMAEGRASVRTITADEIVTALCDTFETLGISKKAMDGVEVSIDLNAQDFPSAYKYTPESTIVDAIYKGGSWRVTSICRDACRRYSQRIRVKHTEASREAILSRFTTFR